VHSLAEARISGNLKIDTKEKIMYNQLKELGKIQKKLDKLRIEKEALLKSTTLKIKNIDLERDSLRNVRTSLMEMLNK